MSQLFCGIDIGSTTTELVVVDEDKKIVYFDRKLTAGNVQKTSNSILEQCCKALNIKRDKINKIVSTGYGRKYIEYSDRDITEITCYARGANYLNPDVHTIIDIGGQDSKVISINGNGEVNDFVMNDKCAAGTGKFLEMIARTFDLPISELGPISIESNTIIPLSSICAVFTESEVISLISQGKQQQDIIHSIHHSIVQKIRGMANRITIKEKIMFCGGVAANSGMVRTLKNTLEIGDDQFFIPEQVEIVGALGAALFAMS